MNTPMYDGTANQYDDTSYETCEVCRGSGYIDVDDENEQDCDNCGGIGTIYYSEVKYDY